VDGNSNVYTTGLFTGSVNFNPSGTYILNRAGGADIFVSKLDTNGNFVSAADMGGPGTDDGVSIAVDSSSSGSPNVYTTGLFRYTADFNPNGTYNLTVDSTAGGVNPDLFVSKLTQSGPLLVTRGSTSLGDATNSDRILASLLVPGSIIDTASDITDNGSPKQLESRLVEYTVTQTVKSASPTLTLLHAPSSIAADWLFADLVSGGLADALTADTLLVPSA
jgi:hypothetical protein